MSPDSPRKADAEDAEDADDAKDAERAEREESAEVSRKTVLLHADISGAILGAFFAVHSELGSGFLEVVYENALTVLMRHAGLRVDHQVPFEIMFHGQCIGRYRADLVVESRIVVEIKAARCIIPQHCAQLLNYLRASGLHVGLLLNFGERAELKRVVRTKSPPR